MKLHTDRLPTCFPLGDVVAVLDQDQSGPPGQVRAQGGVLGSFADGAPMGTKHLVGKRHFGNQIARLGATSLSLRMAMLRTNRQTRRLTARTVQLCDAVDVRSSGQSPAD